MIYSIYKLLNLFFTARGLCIAHFLNKGHNYSKNENINLKNHRNVKMDKVTGMDVMSLVWIFLAHIY